MVITQTGKNIVNQNVKELFVTVELLNSDMKILDLIDKNYTVNEIVNELNGEKIDIIPYSDSADEYIVSALSPATVLYIHTNLEDKTSLAVVPDDKLSLAIGKSGQNVRLAAKLTGWKIDVKAKSAVPSLNLEEEVKETEKFDNLFDGIDDFGDIN